MLASYITKSRSFTHKIKSIRRPLFSQILVLKENHESIEWHFSMVKVLHESKANHWQVVKKNYTCSTNLHQKLAAALTQYSSNNHIYSTKLSTLILAPTTTKIFNLKRIHPKISFEEDIALTIDLTHYKANLLRPDSNVHAKNYTHGDLRDLFLIHPMIICSICISLIWNYCSYPLATMGTSPKKNSLNPSMKHSSLSTLKREQNH